MVTARWLEVKGFPEQAVNILQTAIKQIENAGPGQKTAIAAYITALGWTEYRANQSEVAKQSFENAIKINPTDRRALAGMAKVALDRRDYDRAVRYCLLSEAQAPLTDVMGWHAIALQAQGKVSEAKELIQKVAALNDDTNPTIVGAHAQAHEMGQEHTHNDKSLSRHTHSRLYAKFLADIGERLKFAHHAAEEDLTWRKDIGAYDTFAWTTYQYWKRDPNAKETEGNGLLKEAFAAIERAVATGTKDHEILSHHKTIAADFREIVADSR
jgi:tetratricopeptide (TPR) repeat protein